MFNFSNSLGFLLFKKLFFIYILVVSIFTTYEIYMQINLANKSLQKEFEITKSSYQESLGRSVWNFDRKNASLTVDKILSSNHVSAVVIKLTSGEIFVSKGRVLEKSISKSFDEKTTTSSKEVLKTYSFDIFNKNSKKVGTVFLYYDKDTAYTMIEKSIFLIAIITFLKFIFLFIFLIYFIKKLIVKPLNNLIDATKHLDGRNKVFVDDVLDENNKTELAELTDSFNYMALRINEDFEEMTKLNVKLNKQKKELIQADKYKNFFLANISHELKTPLNPITLISSVMLKNKDNSLNEENLKNIKIINKSANELKILIDDILDLTKIESKDIKLNLQEANLKEVFNTLVSIYDSSIRKKGLMFNSNYNLSEELYVVDVQRFKQVCRNLLSNAVKFTSQGKIEFNFYENKNYIFVEVKDTGIGISKKNQEEIFTSFKQLDGTTTRKYNGAGLGLAISKELVSLQGGEIVVNSKENFGSSFTFSVKKSDLGHVSKVKTDKQESVYIEPKIEEEKNEKNCITVFILNTNPLLFFKLGVELNKDKYIKLVNIKDINEFFKKHDDTIKEYLIVEKLDNNAKLMKIKNSSNLKIISISKDKENTLFDLVVEQIDNKYLLKYIKNTK
ncbi:hypothetical protein CP960_10375 [Malaciobacter halophilus]|uniref:histidine kinase n=1 Tax=Malaciobacter halophilus TaxID=197482 RepID=A0A2N1J0Y6_9BACT|nr:HAMP domain-containing sensor histidine kinase [Malaciobacter halophilus]AXH09462.1 two-component system sensor histidine kinase [Malaciobacter halophilus]PKI80227.1 hypothetical protein CP960_10375 [Malaciobacter halophilus]